jgi:hypothetical protein
MGFAGSSPLLKNRTVSRRSHADPYAHPGPRACGFIPLR